MAASSAHSGKALRSSRVTHETFESAATAQHPRRQLSHRERAHHLDSAHGSQEPNVESSPNTLTRMKISPLVSFDLPFERSVHQEVHGGLRLVARHETHTEVARKVVIGGLG